ncbi:MAG: Lipoprotein-releasing system ATP-binding protein LolD [Alphaproteobacteria bacterium MarineAlpha2_Bin1]|nr:MAG: Lipoprotein-releasing system ATP-binding protein LolD [Alphaproteobacteria bacterium MarineAlpha2_Bin1]
MNGQNITNFDERKLAEFRKQNIGIVFQSFHLLPNLTAIENVALPLQLLKSDKIKKLSSEALNKVGLSSRTNHLPSQLSGGEQQRVALARAFIGNPKIILADEPTGNLDSKNSSIIIDMLFSLKEENKTTLIFATHDEKLSNKCDRITKIKDGKIFQ